MVRIINSRLLILALIFTVAAGADGQKTEKKGDALTPVLWESVTIPDQDLFNGPGGSSMKPDLSNITFVEEDTGGHSKKYKVKDGSGKTWVVKIGDEAQSETAAVRLLAAIGYKTEINYLIPTVEIPGKGVITNARFEARPENVKRGDNWSWKDNPFKGTPQFQGLKIMMSFFNNWDMKEANNVIFKTEGQQQYVISDLGVSFGKTGSNGLMLFWRLGRSRNEPEEYAESDFIKGRDSGKLQFAFNGKNDGSFGDITIKDGRWLADLLIQLTDKQISDAFKAANYSDPDISLLVQSVKSRIRALDLATTTPNVRPKATDLPTDTR